MHRAGLGREKANQAEEDPGLQMTLAQSQTREHRGGTNSLLITHVGARTHVANPLSIPECCAKGVSSSRVAKSCSQRARCTLLVSIECPDELCKAASCS